MFFSYFFYFSLFFACIVIAYLADKYESIRLRNLLILILACATGFRGHEVGIDTPHYIDIWDNIMVGDPVYQEVGFQWLILLLQKISEDPTILFVACSTIVFGFLIVRLWDFREVASFSVMTAVLYMLLFMQSMNTIRQHCALSIIFFCTRYLFQKSYFRFMLGVGIATLLHISSLLAISFVGFDLLKWKQLSWRKKMFLVLLIVAGGCSSMVVYNFIYSEYGNYFEQPETDLGLLTIILFIFVLCSYGASKLWKKRIGGNYETITDHHYLINVVFVAYLMGILLQSLGYFFPYMGRIGLLFSLWGIVFWGMLFKLTVSSTLKLVYGLSMLLLIGWPFGVAIINNGYGTVPYMFCW